LGIFREDDGVIKGDVDAWGFNSKSDQGSGSRFGGKTKAGPNGSMVKFCKGNMVVDAQFYKSPVGRKRRMKHMINSRGWFIQGFEEGTIVRSRWVKDISERAR
jgi:hypothetical protein